MPASYVDILVLLHLCFSLVEIMRAIPRPDFIDETEYEDVPKAFIGGSSDGPIPLTDLDSKEINLATTDDFVNITFSLVRHPADYHRPPSLQSVL